jgi:hypothetical protein
MRICATSAPTADTIPATRDQAPPRRNEIMSGKEQVSVTQPGRLYGYENFVPNGCGDVHFLEVEPTTD